MENSDPLWKKKKEIARDLAEQRQHKEVAQRQKEAEQRQKEADSAHMINSIFMPISLQPEAIKEVSLQALTDDIRVAYTI